MTAKYLHFYHTTIIHCVQITKLLLYVYLTVYCVAVVVLHSTGCEGQSSSAF